MKNFIIDEVNSDDEYLYIDVAGCGTVVIKKDEEGIAVDIFPLYIKDNPIASCWALYTELEGN